MARTPRDPKDVTPKELEILQLLWEDGPATIRALTDRLYPGGGAGAYGSVQKLLERLEEKGMVARRRTGPAHTFAATVARADLIGRRLREVAETLCGGSLTPLLTHLVKQSQLSERERRDLRNLIDDLDRNRIGHLETVPRQEPAMETLVQIGLSNAVVAILLAAVAASVGAVTRKPALTHTLWLLVLLKLVTPPLVRVPIGWSEPVRTADVAARAALPEVAPAGANEPIVVWLPGVPGEAPPVEAPAAEPVVAAVEPAGAPSAAWWQLGGAVWLLGAVAWFGLALWRVVAFQRLLRFGRPAPEWLCQQVAALGAKLGLKRVPPVLLVPGRIPPLIWTTPLGPRLVLPAGLWESLTGPRRETLLVHELAHLRRRDHWVRALELVVLGLYWWHPLVWIACRQLREAEEQCCDAWVVATLTGSGRTYAEAILETLDFLAEARAPEPLLASGALGSRAAVADLKRRLTMILRGTTPRALTWRGLIAVLLVAGLLLPALPVWAQQPGDKDTAAALKELRQKLADLEKKVGQPATPPRVDPAALKKAEAELAEAQAALKKKAGEMEAAAKKVAEAQARVRQAGGKVDGNILFLRKTEWAEPGERERVIKIWGLKPGQTGPGPMQIQGQTQGRIFEVPGNPGGRRIQIEVRPDPNANPRPGPGAGPMVPPPGGDRRIENLEQKLDRLMQEIQELRRSLPRPGGAGGAGGSRTGGGVGGGGAGGPGGAFEFRLVEPVAPGVPQRR